MKPATYLHYGGIVSHAEQFRDFTVISVSFTFSSPLNQGGEP